MDDAGDPGGARLVTPGTVPEQAATFRHLDPAAALAFRTPLQEHPPAADTKAAALVTGFGLMFTLLARFADLHHEMLRAGGLERILVVALLIGFGGASLVTIVQAFRTISPRFPPAPPSLAFFGDIARLSREQYLAAVSSISHERALEEILNYNFTLASICVEKFRHLRMGIRAFEISFVCWVVMMIVTTFRAYPR